MDEPGVYAKERATRVARHVLKCSHDSFPGVDAVALRCYSDTRTLTVGEVTMLWTIFVVLLVLWFLGVVSSYTLGGFIHLLLVLAVIAVIVQLISGRRTTI